MIGHFCIFSSDNMASQICAYPAFCVTDSDLRMFQTLVAVNKKSKIHQHQKKNNNNDEKTNFGLNDTNSNPLPIITSHVPLAASTLRQANRKIEDIKPTPLNSIFTEKCEWIIYDEWLNGVRPVGSFEIYTFVVTLQKKLNKCKLKIW